MYPIAPRIPKAYQRKPQHFVGTDILVGPSLMNRSAGLAASIMWRMLTASSDAWHSILDLAIRVVLSRARIIR